MRGLLQLLQSWHTAVNEELGRLQRRVRAREVIDRPVKEPEQATRPELRPAGGYWLMARPGPDCGRAGAAPSTARHL